jgi:hypothetical protein
MVCPGGVSVCATRILECDGVASICSSQGDIHATPCREMIRLEAELGLASLSVKERDPSGCLSGERCLCMVQNTECRFSLRVERLRLRVKILDLLPGVDPAKTALS